MGKYTAWDDPRVDQTVQGHLDEIASMIRSRVAPQAIILRGSFSQGEGSVLADEGKLTFLSDYELIALTPRYRDRRWLQTAAKEMARKLDVETSISRVHPESIEHNSLGNSPIKGIARPTIAMYELQHSGRTLYGEDWLHRGPAIDPSQLEPWVGLRLLLNRMAESLNRLPGKDKDWNELRWINKTILSCAEALLILRRQYHYSYAERGRRFASLAPELAAVLERAPHLPEWVSRATAFKLCPSRDLYAEPLPVLWDQVKQACDATLRYLSKEYLRVSFDNYADFPGQYLRAITRGGASSELALNHLRQNLWLGLKFLRNRRIPPVGLYAHLTYPAYQVVYSVVPLVFLESGEETCAEASRWLDQVGGAERHKGDGQLDWNHVQRRTAEAWHDLCYGMWDTLSP